MDTIPTHKNSSQNVPCGNPPYFLGQKPPLADTQKIPSQKPSLAEGQKISSQPTQTLLE